MRIRYIRVGVALMALSLSPLAMAASAQAASVTPGSSSRASIEIRCGFAVPALAVVRDIKPVDVQHLGNGVHEVSSA